MSARRFWPGHAAGQVLAGTLPADTESDELRLAFDFDGVIADDAAEAVFHNGQLDAFLQHEQKHIDVPHNPGPLAPFLKKLAVIQALEGERMQGDPQYKRKLSVAIVTARNAPAHERVVNTSRVIGVSRSTRRFSWAAWRSGLSWRCSSRISSSTISACISNRPPGPCHAYISHLGSETPSSFPRRPWMPGRCQLKSPYTAPYAAVMFFALTIALQRS